MTARTQIGNLRRRRRRVRERGGVCGFFPLILVRDVAVAAHREIGGRVGQPYVAARLRRQVLQQLAFAEYDSIVAPCDQYREGQ